MSICVFFVFFCNHVLGASVGFWRTKLASLLPTSCSTWGQPTRLWCSRRYVQREILQWNLSLLQRNTPPQKKQKSNAISADIFCLSVLNQLQVQQSLKSETLIFLSYLCLLRWRNPVDFHHKLIQMFVFVSPGSHHGPGDPRWAAVLRPRRLALAEDERGAGSLVSFSRPGQTVVVQSEDQTLDRLALLPQQPPATREQRQRPASCRFISQKSILILLFMMQILLTTIKLL